jgi:hypothetical protein
MKSITIHGLDDPLDTLIRQRAKKNKTSLNKTRKQLLAESLGLESADQTDHTKDFQDLSGIWTKQEAKEFLKNTKDFEKIDQEDWA